MVTLAFLSDPPVVARILSHLWLPTAPPPLAPARGGGGRGAWGCSAPMLLSPDDPAAEVPEHAEVCPLIEIRGVAVGSPTGKTRRGGVRLQPQRPRRPRP